MLSELPVRFRYLDAVEGKDVVSCSEGTKLGRADAIMVASKALIL
jgi:hypothetical protein